MGESKVIPLISKKEQLEIKHLPGHDKRARKHRWACIAIHHTGVGGRKVIDELLWKRLGFNITDYLARKDNIYVSAHYTVDRSGQITEIINPDKFVAYHAGKSSFWNPIKRRVVSGMNDYAIGIELIGDGNLHKYSDEQYESLARLCSFLLERYETINPNMIVGHEMISPGRKSDPGKWFDWRKLYSIMCL